MAAVAETMSSVVADTEKVMAILPNFKYSEALVQEETVEEIRCQLKGLSTHVDEVKAGIQTEMDTARQHVQEAEAALEKVKDSERQGVAQLEAKVNTLVEAQMQLQDAEDEKKKVEAEHCHDIQVGDELRQAKNKNITINEGAFCSLLDGSWTSQEDMKENLALLKDYLQEIGTEKTLVAAADGLCTTPEVRGDFDKMAIECITEELSSKLKNVEEKLAERAPVERGLQAELLGLQALVDICRQKATAAEEEHKQVEVVLKGFKTEMKTSKQQVTKCTKALERLTAKMEAEEIKVKDLEEASNAVDRLVNAAKATAEKAAAEKAAAEQAEKEAAEKAAAEKAAAEKAAAEKAEAEAKAEAEKAAAQPIAEPTAVMIEPAMASDLEPPAKRMRTEGMDEPKEAKLEAQVASPARVRVSLG